ncbi:hypothetical protein JTE90_005794 [Oedothorax gibbosus]|uniref:Uncharacterized protein n=1 Tax=Oedothorax gibbosus TaxID=931172 RepID=A0AAV6U8N5_9ARAC|nr:hypothetical protein JTE90_005794 [Oedothorax gibbosus]
MKPLGIFLVFLCCKFCTSQRPTREKRILSENEILEKKKKLHIQKSFVKDWLLRYMTNDIKEYQTYDGWYNNPWHPSLGSAGETIRFLGHFEFQKCSNS